MRRPLAVAFVLAACLAPAPVKKARAAARRVAAPAAFVQSRAAAGDPLVTAQRAVVIDAESGRVLWERNADSPAYPASTTKICTALVFAERTNPTDVVTAPEGIEAVGEASLHLASGERLTAEDLLTGMLLRSANDGCVAAAVHVAGSVPKFADLMNAKAKEVGCTKTQFTNPNGLHDPNHWTTVHDLARLGRAALGVPRIAEIVRLREKRISRAVSGDLRMKSKNGLIPLDPTCVGVKTGYTNPAGSCFVGAFVREGMTLVTATMGSHGWKEDHQALAAYATENYRPQSWVRAGEAFGQVDVEGSAERPDAVAATGGNVLVRKGEPTPRFVVHVNRVSAPLKAGSVVGYVELEGVKGVKVDLVVRDEVDRPRAGVPGANPVPWVVGTGALGLVAARVVFRRRHRGR